MTPPGVKVSKLNRDLYPEKIVINEEDLKRQDESPDSQWYDKPRFVQHIDDGAIASLKSYYSSIIKPTDSVLDLCSSWVSHLPETLRPRNMVGIGMNEAELKANKHLTSFHVKDLNNSPIFEEILDNSTDVVICNVSVDYLVRPVPIFREIHRILKSNGTTHMAFSNRCFPTKVIGKWMGMNDLARRKWVGGYFWAAVEDGWEDVEDVVLKEKEPSFMGLGGQDPLYVVRARKRG